MVNYNAITICMSCEGDLEAQIVTPELIKPLSELESLNYVIL